MTTNEQLAQEERRRRKWLYTEEVSGTIIGPFTNRYSFHHQVTVGSKTWTEKIAQGDFVNDAQAEAWFKEKYPDHYAKGVEMRCYD